MRNVTNAEGLTLGAMISARTTGSGPVTLADYTILCFSPVRWNFILPRSHQAMSGLSRHHRVLFWEDPVTLGYDEATLDVRACAETGVIVITPRLPRKLTGPERESMLRTLLGIYLAAQPGPLIRWYCTPAMLPFSRHIQAAATVYDRTQDFADFALKRPSHPELEHELLDLADMVLTGDAGLDEIGMIERLFATQDEVEEQEAA